MNIIKQVLTRNNSFKPDGDKKTPADEVTFLDPRSGIQQGHWKRAMGVHQWVRWVREFVCPDIKRITNVLYKDEDMKKDIEHP